MRAGAVVVLLLLLLAACTTSGGREPDLPQQRISDCTRVTFDDVRGRPPAYLPRSLSRFPNDDALCSGLWVPRLERDFVPQGFAVRGTTMWLSGMDGGAEPGERYCRVMRLDRPSGRVVAEIFPLTARHPSGNRLWCRHGGGLMNDRSDLWVTESARLWLLDPETLKVRRSWVIEDPVRGSFGVLDDEGRLGLGRFHPSSARRGSASLHWFDIDAVMLGGTTSLGAEDAVAVRRLPRQAQGAVWADLGGHEGLWIVLSNTRCGVLAGPGGRRTAFVPGAEGVAVLGDELWVVSESVARPYVEQGGRPVVPALSRLDTRAFGRWLSPDCSP